jgi:glycosyltransferase involved in cell wall biosynthesis
MNTSPLVSVIIPTYNHARYLSKCLNSVFGQTYKNIEVIVVDNHSDDNTDEVLAGFVDYRLRVLKIHNQGIIAKSRNAGIYASNGDLIAFVDSDDWWDPEKISISVNKIKQGADIVYHDLKIVVMRDQERYGRTLKTRQVKKPVFYDLLINGNAISTSSVVVRAELMRRIGGFSENKDIMAGEDYDAWIRLSKETELFEKVDVSMGYYWTGGGNYTTYERVKRYISAIRSMYILELPENKRSQFDVQMNFKIAKSCFDAERYDEALVFARKFIYMGSVNMIKIKLAYIVLISMIMKAKSKVRF